MLLVYLSIYPSYVQGNLTGISQLQSLIANVTQDMLDLLYIRKRHDDNDDGLGGKGEGIWGCLYPEGDLIPVRTILDFMYVSRGLSASKDLVGW